MNKISKRLETLALFVSENDNVIDVGCDHGLLSIYLKQNIKCSKVIASDINKNALNNAKNNIKKYNVDIDLILTDGINNIDLQDINTIIISGMGTNTILHILKEKEKLKNINKIIIQSNNNHKQLRKYLNNIGFYMKDEKIIFDNSKWYITHLFIKDDKKNSDEEIEYGLLKNKEYIEYSIRKIKTILEKIPNTNNDRFFYEKELNYLINAIDN